MTKADAQQLAHLIDQRLPEEHPAVAYEHLSRGCPLDDTWDDDPPHGISCPVCDSPDMIALREAAFLRGELA